MKKEKHYSISYFSKNLIPLFKLTFSLNENWMGWWLLLDKIIEIKEFTVIMAFKKKTEKQENYQEWSIFFNFEKLEHVISTNASPSLHA